MLDFRDGRDDSDSRHRNLETLKSPPSLQLTMARLSGGAGIPARVSCDGVARKSRTGKSVLPLDDTFTIYHPSIFFGSQRSSSMPGVPPLIVAHSLMGNVTQATAAVGSSTWRRVSFVAHSEMPGL